MKTRKCANCQKDTTNPKYCSRSCSAQQTNVYKPKRKPEGKCKKCEIPINSSLKYCKNCRGRGSNGKQQYFNNTKIIDIHPNNLAKRRSTITNVSRTMFFKLNQPYKCYLCGYPKHIDVCHIKPVYSFPLTSTIYEINYNNLIGLCKNHHWELDHNLLCDDYVEKINNYKLKSDT